MERKLLNRRDGTPYPLLDGCIIVAESIEGDSMTAIKTSDWEEALEAGLFLEDKPLFDGKLVQLRFDPDRMGRMSEPSGHGKITGTCGETMEIYLRINGEHIKEATFFADGCASSRMCGALTVALVKGRNIDDAALIGGDTILMLIGDLPQNDTHCAFLAAEALHAAIHDWMVK
jgi:nitrogen fixation NifU-like protein